MIRIEGGHFMKAMIFVGHGSRTEEGNRSFIDFVSKAISELRPSIGAYAFLEKANPTIPTAINSCVDKGATEISIIPILLLSGIHANVDIPLEIEKAKLQFPDTSFYYASPIGIDEIMVHIVEKRLKEKGFQNQQDEKVLLVAHGSRDKGAEFEFEKLASLIGEKYFDKIALGYLKASPNYRNVLQIQSKSTDQKIYIVPYLLFSGGFTLQIKRSIEEISLQFPIQKMILCNPIGFDRDLIALLRKRIDEVTNADHFHWKGIIEDERFLSDSH